MVLSFSASDLERTLTDRTDGCRTRVVAVVDCRRTSSSLARAAAALAERHDCPVTFVVTWNERFGRLLACAGLSVPLTCLDIADSERERASLRARDLMCSLADSPGARYCCMKGRPRRVARRLAREDTHAAYLVGDTEPIVDRLVSALRRGRKLPERQLAGLS